MNTGRWKASRVHEYCVPSVRVPGPCWHKSIVVLCVLPLTDVQRPSVHRATPLCTLFVTRGIVLRLSPLSRRRPRLLCWCGDRASLFSNAMLSASAAHSSVVPQPRWRRHLVNGFLVFHTLSMIVYYPYFFLTADMISLFLQRYFSAFYFICILIRIYLPEWL